MRMRITNKVMQNNALSNINNNKVLQDTLNTQLSTGKKSGSSSVVTSATTAKMTMIERLIKKNYYMDVDEEELRDGIYRGMLASLNDPYSEYYSAEDLKEVIESNEGIYYGIGAYVSLDTDLNLSVISGIISGTPAEEAGLQEGDIIYKVDGTDTTGMSVSEVVSMIRGEEHTTVDLSLIRDGEVIFPRLDTKFQEGDQALMFTNFAKLKKLEKMFGIELNYSV